MSEALDQAVMVVQVADLLRTYTVVVTAFALAFTIVNALTARPIVKRIAWFVLGIDVTLIAVLFAQLANLGRSITWRTEALAVGITLIAVTSWLEIRARRTESGKQPTERTEDGDQSS